MAPDARSLKHRIGFSQTLTWIARLCLDRVEVDGHLNSLLAVVQKDMTDDTVLFLRLSFSSLALSLSLARSLRSQILPSSPTDSALRRFRSA
jgi:hypothetical protein